MKTDAQIQLDVIAELQYLPTLNSKNIGVSVQDGIVTLMSTVESYFEKKHAEKATEDVSGVRGIAMEIEVQLSEKSKRSDSEIAHAIDQILTWNALLPQKSIHVKVEKGWVTIEGDVRFYHQKEMLNASITHLIGVAGIRNHLEIKNEISKADVKSDIVKALHRGASKDASNITVTVQNGVVTLSGVVHSWHERSLIKNAAWYNPNVVSVIDNTVMSI